MKLRTALPILVVAALIMMIGWESALAEETPPPVLPRRPRVFQPRNKRAPVNTPPGQTNEAPPLPSVQLPPLPTSPTQPAPGAEPAQGTRGQVELRIARTRAMEAASMDSC